MIGRTTGLVLTLTWAGHLGAAGSELSFSGALAVLPGLLLLGGAVLIGYVVAIAIPTRLPDLFWISMVTTLAGLPFVPGSEWFLKSLQPLRFVAMITPVLAFAALSLRRREVTLFRATGYKMILISLLVFLGTYFGSAIVAHVALQLTGS
ncbi:MAG: hypothetical protein AAF358_17130 [Pseudomonadota bacterium]